MTTDEWVVNQTIPERLPLLDRFLDEDVGAEESLGGHAALLIQHQVGSIVPMVEALIRLGLPEHKIYWVDIPYSANRWVREKLLAIGIPAANFAPATSVIETPFTAGQLRRVVDMLTTIEAALPPGDPLLVLDDGAYVLQALAAGSVWSGRPVKIVEQTTRGMMRIRDDPRFGPIVNRLPVVNVAESAPKRNLEGPCIGRAIWEALYRKLDGEILNPAAQMLVMGLGTVGRALADALIDVAHVSPTQISVCDPRPEPRRYALSRGMRLWTRRSSPAGTGRFDLVIGCTGRSSFGPADARVLSRTAILASASSGDEEFSKSDFVDQAGAGSLRGGAEPPEESAHDDICFRFRGKAIKLLNGGFPINFDGSINCIPPHYMQATRLCMIAGALQAAQARVPGVLALNPDRSKWIMDNCPEPGRVALHSR